MPDLKYWFFTLFVFFAGYIFAQETQPFEIEHKIDSEAFGEERTITVYLPPKYYRYPADSFTVTYVLDGQYAPFIDFAVKAIAYNVNARKITPTIVVGIHSKDRGAEFTQPKPDDEYQHGRAPTLRAHFQDEIIPLIDSVYTRTQAYRSIVGHSSGGLFVLNTLFGEQADLFDGYLAISPAFRPGNNTILEDAEALLKAGKVFKKFLYCSAGTVGEREFLFGGAVKRLDSLLTDYPEHGLIWRPQYFPGLDHWSVVGPALVEGQVAQTRAFCVDLKTIIEFATHPTASVSEQIEAFYATKKAEYGYVDLPPHWYLHQAASEVKRLSTPAQTLDFLNWATSKYPNSLRLNWSKAEMLAKSGNENAARIAFQYCMDIVEMQKAEMSSEDYEDSINVLKKQLKELDE